MLLSMEKQSRSLEENTLIVVNTGSIFSAKNEVMCGTQSAINVLSQTFWIVIKVWFPESAAVEEERGLLRITTGGRSLLRMIAIGQKREIVKFNIISKNRGLFLVLYVL